MPVVLKAGLQIQYATEGRGRPVVLIHSSVSGNRQWRVLTEELRDRYRVLAVNLYGYGETTPWPGAEPRSLAAQAGLILALCDELGEPVQLVGHSFGGSVALTSALVLDGRCDGLVLLEPNPFHLLRQGGRAGAWLEIVGLLAEGCPRWSFRSLAEGGHMAPLTRPELVNPIVREFLDAA
ncbi:MAG: alpha/beta fold hydrolase [Actinomycetota bacterium]|nr:alpha/beta fold hydrolase [Actinomycetota bacterium]